MTGFEATADRTWRRTIRGFVAIVFAIAVVAACGTGGDGAPDDDEPGSAPTVVSTTPADGDTGVALNATVSVEFSRSMDRATTEAAFDAPDTVDCAFDWNADDTVLTCEPEALLDPDAGYAFFVGTDAESHDGVALDEATLFTFHTQGPEPTVVSTTPSDGATGVSLNQNVRIDFSQTMDTVATEAAISFDPPVDCDDRWNAANDRYTCVPNALFDADTAYQVTVGPDAADAGGATKNETTTFTFTTGDVEFETCAFAASEFGACVLGP